MVLRTPRLTPEQAELTEWMLQRTVLVAVAKCRQFQITVALSLLGQSVQVLTHFVVSSSENKTGPAKDHNFV
ncbi:hypothetical protein DVH05_010247 [Phytophthora capsici]|nr:hypothetical protein DVH05_002964 [Phytophthora capsici]KAG1701753.1 hypothetical protein DVH05_010247 [Phytophthora capsici]